MKYIVSLDVVDYVLLCATLIRAKEFEIVPRCSLDVITENTKIEPDEKEG